MTEKLQTIDAEIANFRNFDFQYFCKFCNCGTNDKTEFIEHLHTENHHTILKESNKHESIYSCKPCNYITHNKNNYEKHLSSNKHKQMINNDKISTQFVCEFCNIEYSSRQSLWLHKKKCKNRDKPNIVLEIESEAIEEKTEENQEETVTNESSTNNTIMNTILEKLQNMEQKFQEFKEELNQESSQVQYTRGPYKKKQTDKIINFLDTHCIDAKNISDVTELVYLTNEDFDLINMNKSTYNISCFKQKYYNKLNYFKENDFADAMMYMFRDWFNNYSIYNRPIHCTNIKLRTFYIKEEDEWIKLENTDKIISIIRYFERISMISWLIFNNEKLSNLNKNNNDDDVQLTNEQSKIKDNEETRIFSYFNNLRLNILVCENDSKMSPLLTMISEYFYLSKDILKDT